MMDSEARNIIARAYKRTESLLIEHKDMLEKVMLSHSFLIKLLKLNVKL